MTRLFSSKGGVLALGVFFFSVLFASLYSLHDFSIENTASPPSPKASPAQPQAASIHHLPRYFEKNLGQVDESVDFYLRSRDYSIQVHQSGFVTYRDTASPTQAPARVKARLVGARESAVARGGGNFSNFLGNLIELEEALGLISAIVPALHEQLSVTISWFWLLSM